MSARMPYTKKVLVTATVQFIADVVVEIEPYGLESENPNQMSGCYSTVSVQDALDGVLSSKEFIEALVKEESKAT